VINAKEAAAQALEAAGDAAYAWDLDDDRLEWSGRPLGGEAGDELATGRGFAARIHPDDAVQRQLRLAAHLGAEAGGAAFDCEYRLRDPAGGFVWVHERGRVERTAGGRARRMLGVIRAIGDRKAERCRLERLANYDALTGHYNTSRLREALDQLIAANQRAPRPAAFLCVGVDRMAALNERLGYEAADGILVEIGRRLDSCLRISDLVGRLGGDRFGIVLADCPGEHIAAAAGKILRAVGGAAFATAHGPVAATVSIGSAAVSGAGTTSYDVITRAEAALAEAKGAGRDRHVHYRVSEAQRDRQRQGASLAREVRAALRQDRLLFAFQPVVASGTGAIDYYECLLRMRDGDGRIVGAGEFVPVVEEQGLIRLIDRHALDRALDELAAHDGFALGLNISGLTAADRPWLRALVARLRRAPDLARRLVVEITETAALYDIEESVRFVGTLREAGCRVALDDFGAGHASLRHLHSLAVDTVKIDRAFVRGLAASGDNQAFVRHLLGLAKGFGLRTVAEGVENEEDAAILRQQGVGYLQGTLCGMPRFDRPWLDRLPASLLNSGFR